MKKEKISQSCFWVIWKQRSYLQQWPSRPTHMWKLRSRLLTWETLSWTIVSRSVFCSQVWWWRAERWLAETKPTRSFSGRSLVQQTHFCALSGWRLTTHSDTWLELLSNTHCVNYLPSAISLRPCRLSDRWEYPESSWKIPLSVLEHLRTRRLVSLFQLIRGRVSCFSAGPEPRQVQHGLSFLRINSLMRRSKHRTIM